MHEIFSFITGAFAGRNREEWATLVAHFVSPLVVLTVSVAATGGGFIFDLASPVSITRMVTELSPDGTSVAREGIAVILEPAEAEASLSLQGGNGKIWTSLSSEDLAANRHRLGIEKGTLLAQTPLLGVNEPVTLLLEGTPGTGAYAPGTVIPLEQWKLTSRSTMSIVTSVLLASIFALGLAVPVALPKTIPH